MDYHDLLINIIVVPKKNIKVRIYIDFRELNKEALKLYYPLSNIDLLVYKIVRHVIFSFMDGYPRYNKIKLPKKTNQ